MIKPITREESYLSKLAGMETNIPDKPITRKEMYLSRLCLKEGAIPERPITREEVYLAKLCGESVTLPSPITRLEKFMSAAAGVAVVKPTPITREEYLWDKYRTEPEPIQRVIDWTPLIHITDALAKPVVDLKIKINPVQSGTGDPSPENIRPISGWTGAQVYRTGKNLFAAENPTSGYYIRGSDGTRQTSQSWLCSLTYSPIKGGASYTISKPGTGSSSVAGFALYDENKNYIRGDNYGSWTTKTITTPENARYFRASWSVSADNPIMLIPSEAEVPTTYTPYTGTTYPITWQTEAGTVYGGELDVTTGVLTVDRAMQIASECMSVSTASTGVLNARVRLTKPAKEATKSSDNISSSYKFIVSAPDNPGYFRTISNNLYIYDNRFTDKETADTILLAEQPMFVYELATPLTYQLTPTEVTTLLGVNNIWADTGDSRLIYLADPNSPEPVQATRALRSFATAPVVEEPEAEPEEDPETD